MNELELMNLAFKENNKKYFDQLKKSDLHNHALLGSNRKVFNEFFPTYHLSHFETSNNIKSLSLFIKNNIILLSKTKEGQIKLFECTILTAINDGITHLDISVDYRNAIYMYKHFNDYVKDLKKLKDKYKQQIKINYDLGISRESFEIEHESTIINLIKSKIFNGIDLYGDELSKPIDLFVKIYQTAQKFELCRKAHVGEFGTAQDIYIAIKLLHLNTIQHGIAIISDQQIMRYAKEKNIQFNICPTSNILLSRITDIKNHPIKEMFNFGLKVTINTDDQLIFERSLFDEYMLLYSNKVFNIEELNIIRINSLS